ncbi:MAG: porin [Massilia sp.]
MKKSILALAVLAAVTGTAAAQSNVTVYGIVDVSLSRATSSIAPSITSVDSGNWYGSRLGFKGSEDLGGGLTVNYQLENGFSADTGNLGQSGRIFGRHAWVGIKGDFGALRFGRSWTPTYCALTDVIDPFEDGMAGAAASFFGRNTFTAIDIRMQNAIFYAKTLGPLTASVAYSLGEVAGNSSANSQLSSTFTYVAGPLTTVFGYNDVNNVTGTGSAKLTFIGANYNFGPARLHFGLDRQKTDLAGVTTTDASDMLIGLTVPVGAGRILASYNRLDDKTVANLDSHKLAIGYTYAMSTRTTLYTSYGHVNTNDANRFNVGIRHKF